MLKNLILGIIIIVFLSIGGLVLFFPLDSFIKEKIEESAGPYISFSTLKIGWNSIKADNVLIKTPAGTDFLKIKQLRLKPSFLGLLRKKLEIKDIELDSPALTIKKAKNGNWLLPEFKKQKEKGGPSLELVIKSFDVNNGEIFFADDIKGFRLGLSDINIDIKSMFSLLHPGKTSVKVSAKLPDAGAALIKSDGNIAGGNFKGTFSIKNLNLVLLKPYIEGDVNIKRGRLNLDSKLSLNKWHVNAPSHLHIKDLDIEGKGAIMGVSAPLVVELIKKKGTVDLDFNIWGKYDNLQNDLKGAFQKKVFTEVGKTITKPLLENVVDSIGSIFQRKK